ncbi:FAD-dependent oxidoreductase [Mycobacterium sp. SMC-4]|uniref:FAD-dependent oxidoreductase n=1 Tax=Mycobacterium sp. SMC-4 TaxID=2857059 RepID=UPI003CFF607A
MRTLVIGAGPTGLFTAIALARRGRHVTVIDRDHGPDPHGGWPRRGVMQFDHPHAFRGGVVAALEEKIPEALPAMRSFGATVEAETDGTPVTLRVRRATFERVLRDVAVREPGLTLLAGRHVDAVVRESGRVVGLDVGGERLTAELVIDASGRSARITRDLFGAVETRPCGATYVSRQYQLTGDAQDGPVNSPVGLSLSLAGYFAVAFRHEDRCFSITIVHDGTDPRMRRLREPEIFDTAVRAIPLLAEWISAGRAQPLTPVLLGGRIGNTYRSQVGPDGRPVVAGLVAVGDSVCTTTPLAGRGVSLGLSQARVLVELLIGHHRDVATATVEFDRWCHAHIRPWFLDHVHSDEDRLRRWAGGEIDLTRPLPSDLVIAAAQVDPSLRDAVSAYERMSASPSVLATVADRARSVYATGWRPPIAVGPDREELAQLCRTAGERTLAAV